MRLGPVDILKDVIFPAYDKQLISKITDSVKQPTRFKRFNLQDNFFNLGKFDIVFCRNVAIYFSNPFKKELFNRIANTLNKGGFFSGRF